MTKILWAASLVLVAMIFFSITECNKEKQSNAEAQEKLRRAQNTIIAGNEREKVAGVKLDSLGDEIKKLDTIVKDVFAERDVFKKQLDITKTEVRRLSDEVRTARVNRDTARYHESCDSLEVIAREQTFLLDEYVLLTDSLETLTAQQRRALDSTIRIKDALYTQIRDDLHSVSNELIDALNNPPKSKPNAWNRWIKPSLSALAAAAITAAATK